VTVRHIVKRRSQQIINEGVQEVLSLLLQDSLITWLLINIRG